MRTIASEIHALSPQDVASVADPSISNPTLRHPRRHRARSFSQASTLKTCLGTALDPLLPYEKAAAQQAYLALFSHSVLDYNHIQRVESARDDAVLAFYADCRRNAAGVRHLAAANSAIVAALASLAAQFNLVAQETSDFARQLTALIDKQRELEARTGELDRVLGVFEPLDRISRTLVSSGSGNIRNGKVASAVAQLEQCLDFLQLHRLYKDAEVYLIRYRQCMTRALTLVRNYLIDYIKKRHSHTMAALQEKGVSQMTLDIYAYTELEQELENQPATTRFSALAGLIHSQCAGHSEYVGLLADTLQQYFVYRVLLVPLHVLQQQPDDGLVLHTQRLLALFKRLLQRETLLFRKFFAFELDSVTRELYGFYKQVLEPMYDDLRSRILRESRIEELCSVANLLAGYYEFEHKEQIDYAQLFQPVLTTAQSRLVFRIQNYIDGKLLYYKPQPEDLQLGQRRSSSARRNSIEQEFEGNTYPGLYVPVGKALTLLSSIYELVSTHVFDDLAHYIIHSCIEMLRSSALPLATAHLGPADAHLFLLKNMIMLKNQLNNFDIQFVRTETSVDFTGGIQELIQIFRRGELALKVSETGGLLKLAQQLVPKVIDNMIDAKQEVELELSNCVNSLVTECTNSICAPLSSSRPLGERVSALNDNLLVQLPKYHAQMVRFVEEADVVNYLVDMLANLIVTTYEKFHAATEADTKAGKVKPEEMEALLSPEAFFNFVNGATLHLLEPEFKEDILDTLVLLDSDVS